MSVRRKTAQELKREEELLEMVRYALDRGAIFQVEEAQDEVGFSYALGRYKIPGERVITIRWQERRDIPKWVTPEGPNGSAR